MKNASTLALDPPQTGILARAATLLYGITCYVLGVAGLSWLILVSLDVVPLTGGPIALASTGQAIALNLGLVALFGLQHVIMARTSFKQRWRQVLPEATERPTFVVLAGLLMALAMWLWQPLPTVIWQVEQPILSSGLWILGALGWAYLLGSSFVINHFELFGLQQVWNAFRGKTTPQVPFVLRLVYRVHRHPLMVGVLIGLWSKPTMTVGHLVMALGFTTYIFLGTRIEERTLIGLHGQSYEDYRRRVPGFLPRLRKAA